MVLSCTEWYVEVLLRGHLVNSLGYNLLMSYLEQLPGAMQEKELPSGEKVWECVFSPYSMRATTATLLLDSEAPMESVQDLLDHKHITTTQIYDKRRRSVRDSASHKVPIQRSVCLELRYIYPDAQCEDACPISRDHN